MDEEARRYIREEEYATSIENKRIYEAELEERYAALRELGDDWAAKFVGSLLSYVRNQSVDRWTMGSPKQLDVMRKIETKYGDLLFNKAKRKDLIKRRQIFMEKFEKLQAAAKEAKDSWLVSFLDNVLKWINSGKPLTPKQKDVLKKNFQRYKIASSTLVAEIYQQKVMTTSKVGCENGTTKSI